MADKAEKLRRRVFDKAYYDRFYRDPDTSVATEDSTGRLLSLIHI